MLSMRRRGKAQNWYIRGSVTLGERSIEVAEYSTGTRDRAAASHLMARHEQQLREDLLFGPRRRWTQEAKSRIIEETLRPGANVADVARRHGLIPQQLYGWRSAARARESASGLSFVPMEVDASTPTGGAISGNTVAVQAGDMTIHIPPGVSADHIERVLLAVRMSA